MQKSQRVRGFRFLLLHRFVGDIMPLGVADAPSPLAAIASLHGQTIDEWIAHMASMYCMSHDGCRYSVLEMALLPSLDGKMSTDSQVLRLLEDDPGVAAMLITATGLASAESDATKTGDTVQAGESALNPALVPGTFPLYVAALYGFKTVASALVRLGASVNAVDNTGRGYALSAVRAAMHSYHT